MTPTVTLTRGLPASGKSTWARQQQSKDPHLVLVDKDSLRSLLHSGQHNKANEAQVCEVRNFIVTDSLHRGRSVIVHDTNGASKHISGLQAIAADAGAAFAVKDFTHVSVAECIQRDTERSDGVGDLVILRMAREMGYWLPPPLPGVRRFFTGDLHFGHVNIVAWRKMASMEAMQALLIERWNATVGPDDEVIVLGDVAMGLRADSLAIYRQLNGVKFLVPGNHDYCHPMHKHCAKWWPIYSQYFHILPVQTREIGFSKVHRLLCHFPYGTLDHSAEARHTAWRPESEPGYLIHGHLHGSFGQEPEKGMVDVGVDAWDYSPVPASKLAEKW